MCYDIDYLFMWCACLVTIQNVKWYEEAGERASEQERWEIKKSYNRSFAVNLIV